MMQVQNRPASEILEIEEYVRRKYGFDGWWVAIQVDTAVSTFGTRLESLLGEFDDKGKPKYKLESLLRKPEFLPSKQEVTRINRDSPVVSAKPQRKVKK